MLRDLVHVPNTVLSAIGSHSVDVEESVLLFAAGRHSGRAGCAERAIADQLGMRVIVGPAELPSRDTGPLATAAQNGSSSS